MDRYSKIVEKQAREIVLLRGTGCACPSCAFCDYHDDKCADETANFQLNKSVLDAVTGEFGELEVINSGSVFELDSQTLAYIRDVCYQRGISVVHFESHYIFRERIPALRSFFEGIDVKMKIGIETFDFEFREQVLNKGIDESAPELICAAFQEGNFLFGISGQTRASMERDIQLGLRYLERICINIMCKNTTSITPDEKVIRCFVEEIMPQYADDPRVDILISNTDFGVGD